MGDSSSGICKNTATIQIEKTYMHLQRQREGKKKLPAFSWVPSEPPLSGKVLPLYSVYHFSPGPDSASSRLQPWEHWSNIKAKQSTLYRFILVLIGRAGEDGEQNSSSWQTFRSCNFLHMYIVTNLQGKLLYRPISCMKCKEQTNENMAYANQWL